MTQPTTQEILTELVEASSGLTEEQIKTSGVDVLHFLWTIHSKGGTFFVKLPIYSEPHPFNLTVPGLIEEK